MAQREGHVVAVAGVAGVAILQAAVVGIERDVAHAVCRGGAATNVERCHVLSCRDAVHLLALGGAQRAGIVAVCDAVHCVAAKGGAGVVAGNTWAYLGLAFQDGGGGVEAVADVGGAAVVPGHEAAAVLGGRRARGEQLAVEHAALDVQRALVFGLEAAVGAVARYAAIDDGADAAVLNAQRAPVLGDETGGVLGRGVDVASDMEVFDGCGGFYVVGRDGADVVERGDVLFVGVSIGRAVVESQRVLLSVEGAAEVVTVAARHAADLDVCFELHGLAAEAAVAVVMIQTFAEDVPAGSGLDGVLRAACGEVVGRGIEGTTVVRTLVTDIACSALHGAVVVVVIAENATAKTYNGAVIVFNVPDGDTNGDVVTHDTTIVAYNATVILTSAASRNGNSTGTVGDFAPRGIMANDAALIIYFFFVSINVNEDIRADMAVVDNTVASIFVCPARDAAGNSTASDAAIRKDDAVDGSVAGISEEANFRVSDIHTDSADGKSLAIVAAFEGFGVIANAVEITLLAAGVVPVAGMSEGDVGRLLERLPAGIVARIDVIGKGIERCRIGNLIVPALRVVRQAADGFLCPRRRGGEQHDEQHGGCP